MLGATHDVTIVLSQGWTGLVGNNGSGKSGKTTQAATFIPLAVVVQAS